jgi:lipopolysaccharide/colanic/teichoic acid biosynthesis glycosyltransferase
MRRLFDLICAAVGLVVLGPVLCIVALAILISDGRPVLFRQTRVGRNGEPFRILKFRTMRPGAPGIAVTAAGDPRVTRIGASLRRYKLDELPQLFNVLAGEMSLVGPRPEVAEYVELDAPAWQTVLRTRPGITDLATLVFRDEEAILSASSDPSAFYREKVLPSKLALNLGYIDRRSFSQDLKLILLTVHYSLFPSRFKPELVRRAFHAGSIQI